MTVDFIDGLDIKEIEQIEEYPGIIEIYFKINEMKHSLSLRSKNKCFYPTGVFHIQDINEFSKCPFCGKSFGHCYELSRFRKRLFYRLINTNVLRLQWLYTPHADYEVLHEFRKYRD